MTIYTCRTPENNLHPLSAMHQRLHILLTIHFYNHLTTRLLHHIVQVNNSPSLVAWLSGLQDYQRLAC